MPRSLFCQPPRFGSCLFADAARRPGAGEDEDEERLSAANDLAMALQHCSDSRDYEAALPLLQGVLEVYRRTLGDLHEHTLVGIYNLADLCAPFRCPFP